jgi:hypothetical protein
MGQPNQKGINEGGRVQALIHTAYSSESASGVSLFLTFLRSR